MRRVWMLGLLLVAGCGDPGGTDCTAIAVSSITLSLVDPAGAPIVDADVQFAVDGGAFESCESWEDGSYVCGWEVAGDFEVVSTATGFATDTFEVTVGEDECHVVTEVVERTLTPVP